MGKYGEYIDPERVKPYPELDKEWKDWLNLHFDPGHWDTWKDKSQQPSVYRTDVFMPPEMYERLKALEALTPPPPSAR